MAHLESFVCEAVDAVKFRLGKFFAIQNDDQDEI